MLETTIGPEWTWAGYVALIVGFGFAVASVGLAVATRSRSTGRSERKVVADVQAAITKDLEPHPDLPPELAQWEQHAARLANHQLDIYLRHSAAALRQSTTSFRIGMTAAAVGFAALLASLAWLLVTNQDRAWLGVISGVVCEAVASLFFVEMRATRARVNAMYDRAQAEADRVVRARGALSLLQTLSDGPAKDALLIQIGGWLLGGDPPDLPTGVDAHRAAR